MILEGVNLGFERRDFLLGGIKLALGALNVSNAVFYVGFSLGTQPRLAKSDKREKQENQDEEDPQECAGLLGRTLPDQDVDLGYLPPIFASGPLAKSRSLGDPRSL